MLKNISFCVNTVLVNLKKNIASIIIGLFRKTRTKSNHYQKHIQNLKNSTQEIHQNKQIVRVKSYSHCSSPGFIFAVFWKHDIEKI